MKKLFILAFIMVRFSTKILNSEIRQQFSGHFYTLNYALLIKRVLKID